MAGDLPRAAEHARSRRTALTGLLRVAGLSAALPALLGVPRTIRGASHFDDPRAAEFMARAVRMRAAAAASGDQPYGAVIVRDGRIVGEAPSRVVVDGDPTAHAEMEAIRDAARRLGTRNLDGCVMYSTARPCPMCEAAAYWANVERLVFGAQVTSGGAPRLRRC